ncbi:hypothetical protein L9F63_011842, partial [Diploptera punctata]
TGDHQNTDIPNCINTSSPMTVPALPIPLIILFTSVDYFIFHSRGSKSWKCRSGSDFLISDRNLDYINNLDGCANDGFVYYMLKKSIKQLNDVTTGSVVKIPTILSRERYKNTVEVKVAQLFGRISTIHIRCSSMAAQQYHLENGTRFA